MAPMLGLATATDDAWIEAALADLSTFLVDHAHCEMKAATNAMSLAVRHGDRPELVRAMIALAEEELAHFRRVHELLVSRGLGLGAPPVDEYAAMLRRAIHVLGRSPSTLVDRLLVGALIEARSCERFRILSERLTERDDELAPFYRELFSCEAGHYRTFIDLAVAEGARDGVSADDVRARLRRIAEAEGAIVAQLSLSSGLSNGETSGRARAAVHG